MEEQTSLCLQPNNLSNVCRLCLSMGGKLHQLFRLEELESLAITLSMKVTYCTSIKVSKNDILPRKICEKCLNNVNEWYTFKKSCIKTDLTLKKYYKQHEEKLQMEQLNNSKPTDNFKYFDIDFDDIRCDITDDNFDEISTEIQPVNVLEENVFDDETNKIKTLTNLDDCKIIQKPDDVVCELTELVDESEMIKKPFLRKVQHKFQCKLCPDSFYHSLDLRNHVALIHRPKYKKTFKKIRPAIPRSRYEMKCNVCARLFFSKLQFRNHYLKKHPGQKPFCCEICGKKDFISEETLKRHKMLHSGKYRCNTCGKTFTCNAILMIHIRDKHENDKPFVCDVCGKRFVTELLMNYHKRFHTGEKKYICDECGLAVVTSSSLAKHKRTHSDVKPHVCELCNKGFVTKGRLVEHFRVHTGERPYTCDVCNKSFTIRDKLKRHCKIHTGEKTYSCEYCGNNYSTSYGLSVHMKSQNTHN